MAEKTKYIFVSGGVLSGLGKGVCAASLAVLLKKHGYKISSIKCENYLNVDSGTINPIEHGDPFLCNDGLEADMDLGTYERFLEEDMGRNNFTTMGQIYKTVIDRERSFGYKGEDVEAIPHVSDEIIRRVKKAGETADIVVVELGGTAGEYQNMLYYEACRIMKTKMPGQVINVHVSYLPVPNHIGEPKTMPTQMSVRTLMSMGIQPEFLILRGNVVLDKRRRYLLGLKCGLEGENVIIAEDLATIYELPVKFLEQKFDRRILRRLKLKARRVDLSDWKKLVKKIMFSERSKKVSVAIVGKYFSRSQGDYELSDAYASLIEAIRHASWALNVELKMNFINAETLEEKGVELLKDSTGIIVPIGWGERGSEGKIVAVRYARENKIPYLGLCYGMQLACVEYSRNVLGWTDSHSREVNPSTTHPIIHDIPFDKKYQVIKGEGVSMRLGAYDCVLKKNSLIYNIYKKHNAFKDAKNGIVSERHRHRYEFNNKYRPDLEKAGLVISGTSPDNFFVEMIELPTDIHPFFVGTQGHPEYKSRPLAPHPLFVEFLRAATPKQ